MFVSLTELGADYWMLVDIFCMFVSLTAHLLCILIWVYSVYRFGCAFGDSVAHLWVWLCTSWFWDVLLLTCFCKCCFYSCGFGSWCVWLLTLALPQFLSLNAIFNECLCSSSSFALLNNIATAVCICWGVGYFFIKGNRVYVNRKWLIWWCQCIWSGHLWITGPLTSNDGPNVTILSNTLLWKGYYSKGLWHYQGDLIKLFFSDHCVWRCFTSHGVQLFCNYGYRNYSKTHDQKREKRDFTHIHIQIKSLLKSSTLCLYMNHPC